MMGLRCFVSLPQKYVVLSQNRPITNARREVRDKVSLDGLKGPEQRILDAIGWMESIGIGKMRGFKLERVLLICHGACHNDTIITVERKKNGRL